MSITAYVKAGKRAYRAKIKFQTEQYTKAGFATKEDARAWMVGKKRELKNTASLPQEATPFLLMFSAASAKYLADCKARMQPGTLYVPFEKNEWVIFMQLRNKKPRRGRRGSAGPLPTKWPTTSGGIMRSV